jgi:Transposase DDE domain group 1
LLYAIRLPSNPVLEQEIEPLLKRPVGRPPQKPIVWYDDFWYQAASWDRPRRVVAKVEWHLGELFPRVGFLVTNLWAKPEGVVHFYNGRGIAEQWIKEGKYAVKWTRLSCHRFVANQVRLQLFILAYNLGNVLRRLTLPKAVMEWSLRSVQLKLVKTGARLVRHARRLVFQMAEVAVPRDVWMAILERIGGLRLVPE